MIISKEDIYIIFRLHRAHLDKKEITSWMMAKEYYSCEGKKFEKDYNKDVLMFLSAKTNLLNKKIKRLEKYGLLTIQKNSRKNIFSLNYVKVIPKRTKFPDGKISESLCIKNEYNKWDIFQI